MYIYKRMDLALSGKNQCIFQLTNMGSSEIMSYIIKTEDGKIILIDGGTKQDAPKLERYIRHLGGEVNTWLFTSLQSCHIGAALGLAEKDIPVGRYVFDAPPKKWFENNTSISGGEKETVNQFLAVMATKNTVTARKNMVITVDRVPIQIMSDCSDCDSYTQTGDVGIVYRLQFVMKNVLFLGNIGAKKGEELAREYGQKLKSDIVQMVCHGENRLEAHVYKLIAPQICLWPAQEADESVSNELGAKINISYKDGDICIM